MIKKALLSIILACCVSVSYADTSDATSNVFDSHITGFCAEYSDEALVFANQAYLSQIIIDCAKQASKVTKSTFNDFNSEQYNEFEGDYTVNNARTRMWYNEFLNAFCNIWKERLENQVKAGMVSLEDYAKMAFATRHYARVFTRFHSNDIKNLENIKARDLEKYGNPDGPTFEYLLERQVEKQRKAYEAKNPGQIEDFDLNEALDKSYRSIIESSTRTNKWVNTFMQCYNYVPEWMCDYAGIVFTNTVEF